MVLSECPKVFFISVNSYFRQLLCVILSVVSGLSVFLKSFLQRKMLLSIGCNALATYFNWFSNCNLTFPVKLILQKLHILGDNICYCFIVNQTCNPNNTIEVLVPLRMILVDCSDMAIIDSHL